MVARSSSNDVNPCSLLGLPSESLTLLLDFCDRESLRNLGLTCKNLYHNVILPIKYREIDISAHNLGRFPYTHWNKTITYYWSDQYPPRFDVEDLARRQHKILQEMLDRPYLAHLVHNFTWTLRSYCDPEGYWPGRMTKDAVYPDTHMWNAFKNMINVTKLDLACYQETWDWEYLRQPPEFLFPAVRHLRLSGIMYRHIVESVFRSINPPTLEHLSLDNLQDPGRSGDEYPYQRSANGATNWNTTQMPQDTTEVKLPGTMRGILPLIQGQCNSLRSLYYRKPGWWKPLHGRSALQDEQCYSELALFLQSVNLTLGTFEYEQGVPESVAEIFRGGVHRHLVRTQNPVRNGTRPMDQRFVDHVFPILMNDSWPELKELKLTGVGTRSTTAIRRAEKARLAKHLGERVSIQYEDVGERPCEEFSGGLAR